jgi:mono/diheme cytochrome c family protein
MHSARTILAVAGLAALLALSVRPLTAEAQSAASRRPARPEVKLPEGPVRQIILSSCSACHGIDEYGYYAMDREAWNALIERMKLTPSGLVPGAVIDDTDKEVLLDWLVANFGPEATPFRRQYVVRPVTDETRLDDGEAMRLLDEACASCHSPLGPIISAGLDETAWRERLTAKIATGVPLLIDEVDPLIDWLRRTR